MPMINEFMSDGALLKSIYNISLAQNLKQDVITGQKNYLVVLGPVLDVAVGGHPELREGVDRDVGGDPVLTVSDSKR